VPLECPGSVTAPEAQPGNLCLYVSLIGPTKEAEALVLDPSDKEYDGVAYEFEKQAENPLGDGRVSSFGFMIRLVVNKTESTEMRATWAVTG
jgi:hypothetical protein